MQNAADILTRIINLGQGITQIKDVDILLEKILGESRKIANADAGSIYVKKMHACYSNMPKTIRCRRCFPLGNISFTQHFLYPSTTSRLQAMSPLPARP